MSQEQESEVSGVRLSEKAPGLAERSVGEVLELITRGTWHLLCAPVRYILRRKFQDVVLVLGLLASLLTIGGWISGRISGKETVSVAPAEPTGADTIDGPAVSSAPK